MLSSLTLQGRGPSQTPMARRFSALALALIGMMSLGKPRARAQDLTEEEAVAMALARPAVDAWVEGSVATQEGRARALGATPNPQLIYMREQTFGAIGTGEDYLSVAQTFDLGNRRGLHGEAGAVRAQAARSDGDAMRLGLASEVRERFYEVLYAAAVVRARQDELARIDQVLEVVVRREAGGDASVYERCRLEREQVLTRASLERARATHEGAAARLAAMLGENAQALRLVGELLPRGEVEAVSALEARALIRPDLLALELRVSASSFESLAASRWWAPELRLEVGWKGVDAGPQGRTDGFLLGASLSIPLWDQSQGLAHAAEGEAEAARAERELLLAAQAGEVEALRAEYVRLRHAAEAFRTESQRVSEDLVRITMAAYEGGEMSLLVLLDAARGLVDDELTALALERDARRAQLALAHQTGTALP